MEELLYGEEVKAQEVMCRAGRGSGAAEGDSHPGELTVALAGREHVEEHIVEEVDTTHEREMVSGAEPGTGSDSEASRGEALMVEQPMKEVARESGAHEQINKQKDPSWSEESNALDVRRAPLRHVSRIDPFASVEFVYIPPGVFSMGSPEEEPGRCGAETPHEVTLTKGFFLQTTLVTRRQWKTVMGASPAAFSSETMDCPVDGVSWYDCQELIKKLNAGGVHRYRLPREAEWEYACRAGTSTAFSHGSVCLTESGCCTGLDAIAWFSDNSQAKPHPVARKDPNAWGLYDIHGNLCEWCQDWYGEFESIPQKDPVGAIVGLERVCRGGCWVSTAVNCRSACRFSWSPDCRSDFVGFRLVREGG